MSERWCALCARYANETGPRFLAAARKKIDAAKALMKNESRLPTVLFFLRMSVFLVMFMWTVDKFVEPQHASGIMEHFYRISGVGDKMVYILGSLEMVLIFGFLLGIAKTLTYGLVLLLHAISTLSAYQQYLHPFKSPNLLFFAAWPMLAACFALFYLRDADVMLTIKGKKLR